MKVLIALFCLVTPSATCLAAANAACGPGIFRYQFLGQKYFDPGTYCFDKSRGSLSSANCASGACEAKRVDLCGEKMGEGKQGSPGARLCEQAGGIMQVGAYFDGKDWRDADRCLFEKDKSFLDSGSLAARRGDCFKAAAP
jgi:hypothetical protein